MFGGIKAKKKKKTQEGRSMAIHCGDIEFIDLVQVNY